MPRLSPAWRFYNKPCSAVKILTGFHELLRMSLSRLIEECSISFINVSVKTPHDNKAYRLREAHDRFKIWAQSIPVDSVKNDTLRPGRLKYSSRLLSTIPRLLADLKLDVHRRRSGALRLVNNAAKVW